MRIIKFRGKKVSNNKWAYGCYFYNGNEHGIVDNKAFTGSWVEVHPETVGQFTGLQDKNGRDIYEGDIIGRSGFFNKVIMNDGIGFYSYSENNPERLFKLEKYSIDEYDEIIGNIHENKGGENE